MTKNQDNLSRDLRELEYETGTQRSYVRVPGGRAVCVNGNTYYDNVHYEPVSESWITREKICQTLIEDQSRHHQLYVGVAGEANLDYITCSRASGAVLLDVNPWQSIFWRDFLDLVAACPERDDFVGAMRNFAQTFSLKLHQMYNTEAIRENASGQIQLSTPHPLDVYEDLKRRKNRGRYKDPDFIFRSLMNGSSPFRNFSYKKMFENLATRIGWDTGYTFAGDKKTHWLADPDNYAHLHQMAKAGAIGALTLDLLDGESCRSFAEYLESAGSGRAGLIYLSNIGFYLRDNETMESLQKQDQSSDKDAELPLAEDEYPKDYTGRKRDDEALAEMLDNVRHFTSPDARILRFEHVSGASFFTDFRPSFTLEGEDWQIPLSHEPGGLSP